MDPVMFYCILALAMMQGIKRREVTGNFSSSLFKAIKRELCNVNAFCNFTDALIIS